METNQTGTVEGWAWILAVAGILAAAASDAPAQALTPMRDWTSNDGRVIQAELLVFQPGADNATVRLRLKDGSVFKLGLDRFDREDQAIILKERLHSQFRVEFNRDRDSCFFYSKHLAADDWKNRTWAYIGSDTEKSWLRLAIYSVPDSFSKGAAVVVIGEGVPVRIPFDPGDVDRGRRGRTAYEGIDVSITELSEDFLRVLKNEDRLEFFLEIPGADHQPIPLTGKEKSGLRAAGEAFETVAALSTDKTWWAALIGRDREELIAEEADRLREFRDPEREPLIPLRSWTNSLGQEIEAAIMGFVGPDAVLRDAGGILTAAAATNFVAADLETLAVKRLETSLVPSWHPVDDSLDYYWPVRWEGDRRFRHQAVLFAVERKSRKPRIVLQHVFPGAPELVPVSSELRGPGLEEGLRLPMIDPLKIRGGSGVKVWMPLNRGVTDALLGLIRESEGLDYELESSEEETQAGTLSEEEFSASIEAVEIYRMFDHWRSLTAAPENPEAPAKPESSDTDSAANSDLKVEPETDPPPAP